MQQLEALSKDRDAVVAECEKQKSAAQQGAKEVKSAQKERDVLRKQLEALSKERDAAAAECEKQKAAAEKSLKEAEEAQMQRDLAQKARDQVVLERDEILTQAQQNSDLLKTAQRMLDGQARYLEDLSLKEEQAERAIDELRLLKQEIFHYIQNSRPARSLKTEHVSRLIELVKMPDSSETT